MKIVLMGNAGAGKTTLARALIDGREISRLSLDVVAFDEGTQRRPLAESVADVEAFVVRNQRWIVEGCYADIIEAILGYCDTLVFLNPGVATCIEHCRQRPWEPEKFGSASEQEQNLENLIDWVSEYATRTDEYGLQAHRRLFEAYSGRKFEFHRAGPHAVQQILAAGT